MLKAERFSFCARSGGAGDTNLLPLAPLVLQYQERSAEVLGLLDTGSTVNVLPYPVGVALGLSWEDQNTVVRLTGNLSSQEARAVLLPSRIGPFKATQLAFAWTRAEHVPVILGQINFFMEFDVCFFRSQHAFEVRPKS